MPRNWNADGSDEPVILLDRRGRPRGTAPKRTVHGTDTPLHLGFSCHVFDRDGRVLVTQRAAAKPTWPGTWSNACCGHPQPGETLRAAVGRRLREELGVTARRMSLAVSDFTYRAVMSNGVVEHEVCPVVVVETDDEPVLNTDEVDDASWMRWDALRERAHQRPATLSPWAVEQIDRLDRLTPSPPRWLRQGGGRGLDDPIVCPATVWTEAAVPAPDVLSPILDPVESVLLSFLADRRSELVAMDPALAVVAREIVDLVCAGGKRLRPAFVYWGHRATGAVDDPAVAAVAAAVEMLHTFALLHDDVMDDAVTRRGRPAARWSFASAHAGEHLAGDHEAFGTSAAILAGDLAFVWADQLLETAPLDEATRARVRAVFTALRVEVMAGQYLDLRLNGSSITDAEAAQRVALLKSGRYTVTRPLQLGSTINGRDHAVVKALTAYGDAIGVAFQLRDDILGLFGDPAATGKSTIEDLRAGKRTVLVLRALALVTGRSRDFLDRCLGDRRLDEDDADRCRAIVERSGALASVETLVRHQHAVALDAIADVPQPAKQALHDLASLAAHRDS
jgi:geranylgeranyl diphosphate synthase, type I